MKYIKKFDNLNSLNNYKNTEYYTRPNVSLEIQNKQLSYEQRYKNIEYLDNPNVDLNYQMYINKNFHFINTHQYRIQCKCQYISNKTNGNDSQNVIVGIGKFARTSDVDGYKIYYHNSNYIYSVGLGVQWVKHNPSTEIQLIDDTILGLTNEYYLTLYGNIRAYDLLFTNSKIYYLKITDLTNNQIVCHLIPKMDANENIKYMIDLTDNTKYYLQTLGNRYREESELTKYENESEA